MLVSAVDAPTLFDLRCLVRERLVTFLHESSPQSLPRTRVQMVDPHETADATRAGRRAAEADPTGLFSGTAQGDVRAGLFTGPISTVPAEERIDLEVDGDRWRTHD
ncbi:hypothetical protein [Clavibacter tessellarius]|uniref:hypothetical protein n=1 Tax=Clavibacter tessellarius TaxID=31965 RepID=UPI0039BF524A